jgi:hypothetical protein
VHPGWRWAKRRRTEIATRSEKIFRGMELFRAEAAPGCYGQCTPALANEVGHLEAAPRAANLWPRYGPARIVDKKVA